MGQSARFCDLSSAVKHGMVFSSWGSSGGQYTGLIYFVISFAYLLQLTLMICLFHYSYVYLLKIIYM